jgi:biotin carboxyl carrier protein
LPGELDVVKARIPGRVLRIQAEAGDSVVRGQALMVLEAMKMEDDIRAPRDGVIDRIPVSEGDRVSRGAVLVSFLPRPVALSGGSHG